MASPENIDIYIDIDKDILENIYIDIDIDKGKLQNINIDKISYRLGFGISNTPRCRAEQRGDLVQAAGSHVTFLPPLEL